MVLPEGEILLVPKDALEFQYEEIETVHESFIPHVIEPSIGINRLVQVVLEHCFRLRLADGRKFFTFPPSIAPIKCSGRFSYKPYFDWSKPLIGQNFWLENSF